MRHVPGFLAMIARVLSPTVTIPVLVLGGLGAQGRGDPPLRSDLEAAEAIVRGRVIDVRYRMSERGGPETVSLPHAFVTYRITQVLRGKVANQSTLTLRFLGGPDTAGRILFVGHVPFFRTGDEDVLLVSGNLRRICPLVRCERGRFRLVGDSVFNGLALPLTGYSNGRFRFGSVPNVSLLQASVRTPAPSFDAVLRQPGGRRRLERMAPGASIGELRERYDRSVRRERTISYEIGGQDTSDRADAAEVASQGAARQRPMRVEEFLRILRAELSGMPPTRAPAVASADTAGRFSVTRPRAVPLSRGQRPRSTVDTTLKENREDYNPAKPR